LSVGLLLGLVRTVVAWGDGSYPAGTFFYIHVQDGLTCIYLLFILHYLDDWADAALADFRPALATDDTGFAELRYQLTTMPARPVFVLTLIGLVFGLPYIPLFDAAPELQQFKYFTSPAATIADVTISGIAWVTNVVFAYHTIRQLRLISRIYTRYTNVSIFDSGPLYALSRVTAFTTIALLFLTYVYVAFYGNFQFDSPVEGLIELLFVAVALVTFVWPLLGAHRLLQAEKVHRKSEIARRIETAADEMHRHTDAGDYAAVKDITSVIDGLTKEMALVGKASTWPWDPEALRAVITALLLPLAIWIITRVLERFGI
jgi:hypothetical protein